MSDELNLDLNGDGVFDSKDKSIAAKVLRTKTSKKSKKVSKPVKKEVKKEVKEKIKSPLTTDVKGKHAQIDISLTYRKGDLVPQNVIDDWKLRGIDINKFF